MALSDKLKNYKPKSSSKRTEPLWKGPEKEGITQSLLGLFLNCRERFRLRVVEGLASNDGFNHRLEYGNMWHICEEALADGSDRSVDNPLWLQRLSDYAKALCRRNPTQQEQVLHWYNVCKTQFPYYVEYWAKQKDVTERTPLLQEQVFSVPYKLPSGRRVTLKGKWDSVDLIGRGKGSGIYLQENKTKGDIRENQMKRQLTFDLQTMFYLVALKTWRADFHDRGPSVRVISPIAFDTLFESKIPLLGVRYNVIRRPLSGGKGTIVQHKPSKSNPNGETKEAFYKRLGEYIKEDPKSYFMRWKVEIGQADVDTFKIQFLDPILEQLCDWWEWISFITERGGSVWDNDVSFGARPDLDNNGQHCSAIHWRHPFRVYNSLDDGGSSDVDEYLASGSTIGLTRIETLFPELS